MKVNVYAGEQLKVGMQALLCIMYIGRLKQKSRYGFANKRLLGFKLAVLLSISAAKGGSASIKSCMVC